MSERTRSKYAHGLRLAAVLPVAAIGLAACGSSSSGGNGSVATTTTPGSGGSKSPATSFGTANVSGVGQVVVDGNGRTVYILTAAGKKNVPCDDASGCTAIWPDLALPDGTSKATAGAGLQASLLGTKKLSDGETYPTYNGYLMYEYASDSGPGQAHGQGIKSFGGTWYTLTPAGKPMTSTGSSSSGGGGGYGY